MLCRLIAATLPVLQSSSPCQLQSRLEARMAAVSGKLPCLKLLQKLRMGASSPLLLQLAQQLLKQLHRVPAAAPAAVIISYSGAMGSTLIVTMNVTLMLILKLPL